jgi:hypothetical protein
LWYNASGALGGVLLGTVSGSYIPGGGGTTATPTGSFTLPVAGNVIITVRFSCSAPVAGGFVLSAVVDGTGTGVQAGSLVAFTWSSSGLFIANLAAGAHTFGFGVWNQTAQTAAFAWVATAILLS